MKTQLILLLISVVSLCLEAVGQENLPGRLQLSYGDTVRTYRMFIPAGLPDGAPLVVYTHGYGSKKRWLDDLNQVAALNGFAVCYPDGAPDTRGKDGWYVGYPPQVTMDKDEASFFRKLLDEVCSRFNLSRENVFMAGMSNGGDLCYELMFTDPGLFRAYASVAGLAFEWMLNGHKLTRAVPFMEIHGNADKTSRWEGDLAGEGGWGSYIAVPDAVKMIADNNGCAKVESDTLVSLSDSTRNIIHTSFSGSPSGADVELYEIDGGKHSWAAKDLPTSEIIWRFFERWVRKCP